MSKARRLKKAAKKRRASQERIYTDLFWKNLAYYIGRQKFSIQGRTYIGDVDYSAKAAKP